MFCVGDEHVWYRLPLWRHDAGHKSRRYRSGVHSNPWPRSGATKRQRSHTPSRPLSPRMVGYGYGLAQAGVALSPGSRGLGDPIARTAHPLP